MKKLLLLLITAFYFAACVNKDEIPDKPEKAQAPITVWAYLVADTNIKSDIRNNIKTMYEGLSKLDQRATLLIYWDGGSSDTYLAASPCIVRYTTDGYGNINGTAARDSSYSISVIAKEGDIVKEYDSQLSTDKNIMTSVLKDLMKLSPTNQIAMMAGSHGSAWTNSIMSRSARSFGQDGNGTDNTITTSDMADAISAAGIKLDLLLFDACMMGTVEVCYDFKDATNYMIVSALDVPAPGFPYQDFMSSLYKGNITGYSEICQAYINYYANYPGGWASVALVDCMQMENLAAQVKTQITTHKDIIYAYKPINELQQYGLNPYVTGFKYISFDLRQFIEDINEKSLPSEFQSQLNKTILYSDCLEHTDNYTIEKSKFCGLGMYIPVSVRSAWNTYFKTIDWYKAAGWNEVSFEWGF